MRHLVLAVTLSILNIAPIHAGPQAYASTLESMRDRQRVLLVFSNGDNLLAEAQLKVAADHAAGFRERDLVLTGIAGTDPLVPTAMLSAVGDRAARQRFHVRNGEFTVILLGKDGGEKMRSHKPILWETLRSTIDAMPMRQDEMRRR